MHYEFSWQRALRFLKFITVFIAAIAIVDTGWIMQFDADLVRASSVPIPGTSEVMPVSVKNKIVYVTEMIADRYTLAKAIFFVNLGFGALLVIVGNWIERNKKFYNLL